MGPSRLRHMRGQRSSNRVLGYPRALPPPKRGCTAAPLKTAPLLCAVPSALAQGVLRRMWGPCWTSKPFQSRSRPWRWHARCPSTPGLCGETPRAPPPEAIAGGCTSEAIPCLRSVLALPMQTSCRLLVSSTDKMARGHNPMGWTSWQAKVRIGPQACPQRSLVPSLITYDGLHADSLHDNCPK